MKILLSGPSLPEAIMVKDLSLLDSLDPKGEPLLHFYSFCQDSATYGVFIQPEKLFSLPDVFKKKLLLAKRPTGGGVIFHRWDFAFSFLLPANDRYFSLDTLKNYSLVNTIVLDAVEKILGKKGVLWDKQPYHFSLKEKPFCMASPTKFDLFYEGRKIGGAAQRKKKQGYLHQGSLLLFSLDEAYLRDVLIHPNAVDAMMHCSHPLFPFMDPYSKEAFEMKKEMERSLSKNFYELFQN